MLGREQGQIDADVGIVSVLFEEIAHPRPRVGKQDLVDERDRRRRALDVQQNCPDRRVEAQRDSGTYVGPKQTGWKP